MPTLDPDKLNDLQDLLSHQFADQDLLERALTHASLADSRLESNERLEFLGDAVLGLVVCEYLFLEYENLLEGEMTKIKSSVVSRRACADVTKELGLEEMLQIGKGLGNHATLPRSVLAAVYEAIIGAIYLDGGLEPARRFILKGLESRIEEAAESGHQSNFKSVLQQTMQQQLEATPEYLILDEKGPDHAKCFEVCVEIGARRFSSPSGASKKQAEQAAALEALIALGLAERDEDDEIVLRIDGEDGQAEGNDPGTANGT